MSSILDRNRIVSVSALVSMVALAFSTGCTLESDSVDVDDEEEVGTSEMAISASYDPDAAKASCEARHQVWKNGACTDKCAASYKLYAGKCYLGIQVDVWVQEDGYIAYCETKLHGAWNKGPIPQCVTSLTCSNPPGPLNGWKCVSNIGASNPYWNSGAPNTDGLDIPWCVGLGCGTDTNTINSTDWNPDDNCYDSAHCFT